MSNFSQDNFEEGYRNRVNSIKELKNSMSNYIKNYDCPLPEEEVKKIKQVLTMYDEFLSINKLDKLFS
ncbi:hypothetical protein [Neobacillus drentensis]|uniref:hypothetical protein n=1 Tax=Neobacillus drentensis TaxID=220684 RepID=UPI002FFE78DB